MTVIEFDRNRFAQKVESARHGLHDFVEARRGRSVEIELSTMYLINAHADMLVAHAPRDPENPLINYNVYYKLPQGTDIEIVKQEGPEEDAVYRNIYYTDPYGKHFAYRSVEKDDQTTAKMTSTTSGERDVFQIEGKMLLKVMRGIERSMERREKAKKVVELFRRTPKQQDHTLAA